ncbi:MULTISPECIES: hypothetical protein [Cyanophyceae]|uniref:Uncharacterized protein n=1 Tax=Leptolyngbya subtilissima DQ-A4 TaxID=2933933 RepID=A0ABV0KC75_9CYAN|nr:hypothetical protein [Nodosilinea sp. FACHB-141]MBD2114947.1 hypothetical protein [Nodosilinea sp. FACHB-141]
MSNLVKTHPLWIDTAEDAAEGMHNPKLYIGGGLAGGLVLGSLLNPLTGLAALAYGLYLAWDANERNSDQIEAVSDGLIAHLLDKKQLRAYQGEVGADQVQAELAQAIARELRLSDEAETLAKSLGLLGKPKARPQLPPKPLEAASPSPSLANAAPVPFVPIQLDPDCPHFLLLAGSREGKSNALRCLLDGHARVNYVSTKATDQVPAHWEGYVLWGTPDEKGKQLQWLLAQWGAKLAAHAEGTDTEPEWFVFDEAIQIRTYAKRSKVKGLADALAGLQIEIATQGAAIAAYGVLLAQTKNAGPLGIDLDLLQQNFRMVLPLKSRRRLALSVIEKMGGLRLTTEQREEILSNPNRYLQLWLGEDEDIYHDVLPEFQGKLKPLIKCPLGDGTSAPQQPQRQPQETTEPKPLGLRILDYLKGHGEAKTAREIRGACTRSTDSPRASVDEVRDILVLMISEGQITRYEDGSTERYQVTGTI